MTGGLVAAATRGVARARGAGGSGRQHGQSLVEFAMIVPVFLLLLLGMIEFGFAFTHNQTLEYATREGARTGAALADGSSSVPCATVDQYIVAAVERVLSSPGSPIAARLKKVSTIRIYSADANGNQVGSLVDVWTYNLPSGGGGPLVDGKALDYTLTSTGWNACGRNNAQTSGGPESVGVSLTYTYDFATPLGGIFRFFGSSTWSSLAMSDRTVMALEPTQ